MSGTKITNLKRLHKQILQLKAKGKKIVFTNGCFDLLHYGHVQYLEKAKKAGDILVVAINRDASVKRIKDHGRPVVGERDRARVVAGLESVNYVVLFKEVTPLKIIMRLRPDVLVKGADWSKDRIVGAGFVRSYGGKVVTLPLVKGRSTTNLIKKIAEIYRKK